MKKVKLSVMGAVKIVSDRFHEGTTISGYALQKLINQEYIKANDSNFLTDRNVFRRVRESGMWRGLSCNHTKNILHRVSFYERTDI